MRRPRNEARRAGSDRERDPAIPAGDRFLAQLARMLHEAGSPAYRLEAIVTQCARRLGLDAYIFSLPTSVNLAVVSEDGGQRVTHFRVDPGSPDIALLEETFRVADQVASGELDAPGGLAALRTVEARAWRPPRWMRCLGIGLSSGGAAVFLGGSWVELAATIVVGLALGWILTLARGRRELEALSELGGGFVGSVLSALLVHALGRVGIDANLSVVSLGAIVLLLPGLSLATAMAELATRNLASGSARLMGAVTSLVAIGMGAAIGSRLVQALGLLPASAEGVAVRFEGVVRAETAVALVFVSIGLAIVFHARIRRAWIVLISCVLGFGAAQFARTLVGVEFAPVLAAAMIGVAGNVYSSRRRRPTIAVIVPGIVLLLPGSIGFRGIQGVLASDTVAGISTTVSALVVAASIAAGLLVANALVPPPRES
jgi:uncharacterized membrane protein YjjP (DUF1212 family)